MGLVKFLRREQFPSPSHSLRYHGSSGRGQRASGFPCRRCPATDRGRALLPIGRLLSWASVARIEASRGAAVPPTERPRARGGDFRPLGSEPTPRTGRSPSGGTGCCAGAGSTPAPATRTAASRARQRANRRRVGRERAGANIASGPWANERSASTVRKRSYPVGPRRLRSQECVAFTSTNQTRTRTDRPRPIIQGDGSGMRTRYRPSGTLRSAVTIRREWLRPARGRR
jgi:hypothetical protein